VLDAKKFKKQENIERLIGNICTDFLPALEAIGA
jgi:hypothetical protein